MHLYEFTKTVLLCQQSLYRCTLLVPGDIKLQLGCRMHLATNLL